MLPFESVAQAGINLEDIAAQLHREGKGSAAHILGPIPDLDFGVYIPL